jgi:hypothetical protein
VGVSTDEIDEVVHNAAIECGVYPSPLNYKGFPKSVCTSVNDVVCHGIPGKYVSVCIQYIIFANAYFSFVVSFCTLVSSLTLQIFFPYLPFSLF